MGRKVNPIGFRLGIVSDWESKWYAEKNYTDQLHEDLRIRRLIMRELTRAGISRIELERSANRVERDPMVTSTRSGGTVSSRTCSRARAR